MKNLSLLLITTILLIACSKKEESLAGLQFQLIEAGTVKTPVMVHISFVSEQRMDVWTMRGISRDVAAKGISADVAVTPYQFEDGHLTFRGTTYEVKENKQGFDLYRDQTLAYQLIPAKIKMPAKNQPQIKVDKKQHI